MNPYGKIIQGITEIYMRIQTPVSHMALNELKDISE